MLKLDVKERIIKYSLMCSKYDGASDSAARHNYAMRSLIKLLHKIKNDNIDTSFIWNSLNMEMIG